MPSVSAASRASLPSEAVLAGEWRKFSLAGKSRFDLLPGGAFFLANPLPFDPSRFRSLVPIGVLAQVVLHRLANQRAGIVAKVQNLLVDGNAPFHAPTRAQFPHGVGASPLLR
jgi:hypothetical protein